MSVWENPTYKLATAKAIFETSTLLFEKIYGKSIGKTLKPDYESTGWDASTLWEDIADELSWREPEEEPSDLFLADITSAKRVITGIEASYWVISLIWKEHLNFETVIDWEKVDTTAEFIAKLVLPSAQVAVARGIRAMTKADSTLLSKSRLLMNAAENLRKMRLEDTWDDQDDEYFPRMLKTSSNTSTAVFRKVRNVTIWKGIGPFAGKMAVMTKATADIMIGSLERLGSVLDYVARAWAHNEVVLSSVMEIVNLQVTRAAKVRGDTADIVSAAWHEVRTYVQYKVLKSILPEAERNLAKDYKLVGMDKIVDLEVAKSMMMRYDDASALELIHIYKWMPCVEYDMSACLPRIKEHHMSARACGLSPGATKQMLEDYERIVTERKINIAVAYRKVNGSWPPGLDQNLVTIGPKDVLTWKPKGIYAYQQLGKDISSQVKDKTTVLATFELEVTARRDDTNRNYLLWYLANYNNCDTKEWLRELSRGILDEENFVRVAYKGEAHKQFSRPFFMAPPKIRTLLGEFEGNLSVIARTYPATLIGKSDSISKSMMDSAMDPYSHNKSVGSKVITTTFIVMFDLTKWSAKSSPEQVREYHEFWADVFGNDDLRALADLGTQSRIVSTTDGLVIDYKNRGADLEGFRGRMSTMFHADMLAATCRLAIQEGVIAGRSNLVVFIDDGAVKIEAMGTGDEAEANAIKFVELMQRIYKAGGQEIHKRKVVISREGGEILANFYLRSVKVPQGIKAAMKLMPANNSVIGTLPEELDSVFAASQGAMQGGAKWSLTYMRYIRASLLAVARMAKREFGELTASQLSIYMVTPKSLGGAGMQSVQGLMTTAVINATVEGLSVLNRAARMYPNLRDSIRKVLTVPVVAREPLSILRDPTRINTMSPTLVESRLVQAVLDKLEVNDTVFGTFLARMYDDKIKEHATNVAISLLASDVISVPLLNRAWVATPLAHVEKLVKKFSRSDTIINSLGQRTIKSLRRKNLNDVRKTMTNIARLVL